MPKVVPDTNVLVSAFFFDGNERRVVELAREGKIELIVSDEITGELIGVLTEKFGVSVTDVTAFVVRLLSISKHVKPRSRIDVKLRDESDVIILRTAYDGDADFIVTGDDDLLSMGKFGKIRIVRGRNLVDLIQR
ncbi:MAG: putative toxin-antitoxin system toxin component, PIN family [Candidatus Bathyarchaeia archaeon]